MNSETSAEPMRPARAPVTIKGTREGLVFVLDDQVPFHELLADLKVKTHETHRQLLTGPNIPVFVRIGRREFSDSEERLIRDLLAIHPNLMVQTFQSAAAEEGLPRLAPVLHRGTVRSGQVVTGHADVIVVGDVNPGGEVIAGGDIYVMGNLRGLAHAGSGGDEAAIIAAVRFQPTQLRIASTVSRPPESWVQNLMEAEMEFAYLRNGQMAVEKMSRLSTIRA